MRGSQDPFREKRKRSRSSSRERRGDYNRSDERKGHNPRSNDSTYRHGQQHDSRDSYREYHDGYGSNNSEHQYNRRNDRSSFDDYYDQGRYDDRGSSSHIRDHREPVHVEPTSKIIIKGMPSHTTESSISLAISAYGVKEISLISSRDTGECRGYAFVEFLTLEHAQYFMQTFAGSTYPHGNSDAPPLIIEARPVTIEYVSERRERRLDYGNSSVNDDHRRAVKSDWVCEQCNCQNFAKRAECFRCGAPRTETCQIISGIDSNFMEPTGPVPPSPTLLVKGFGPFVSEDQITELFRQYAVVKNTMIIRDRLSGVSKGMALVEFHTVEYATYALSQAATLQIDKISLRVSYARESFVQAQTQSQVFPTPLLPVNPAWMAAQTMPGMSSIGPMAAASMPRNVFAAQKIKPNWPPNFETNGAAFVFQSQSGYFWEPLSQFYYCPKSKLYYSSNDGSYYHYDQSFNPPFKKFIPPLPLESYEASNTSDTALKDDLTSKALEAMKKPVVISLGGTKSKLSKSNISVSLSSNKKVVQDIAKWGSMQKQEELTSKDSDNHNAESAFGKVTPSITEPKPTESVEASSSVSLESALLLSSVQSSEFTRAASDNKVQDKKSQKENGKAAAICYICRRQFTSAALLQRHEQESELHKQNLAKAQAAGENAADESQKPNSESLGPTYRDRASERRAIHGTSDIPIISDRGRGRGGYGGRGGRGDQSNGTHADIPSSLPPGVVETINLASDTSNPGNQLLRKMGWSEGGGLGKDGQGIEVPVGLENDSKLKVASGATGIGASGAIPSIVYTDNNAYKESLLQATKARYEQVSGPK